MTEQQWDRKLNINTIGRDASKEDSYHYPYEPTPYCVLERLVQSDYISRESIVIDYGCGKGRVGFFLNKKLNCRVIGIDFDKKMYFSALENKKNYGNQSQIQFICMDAENYEILNADSFYFFHPFSIEILRAVIGKIRKSYYANPREIKLFFYYPSDEYVSLLMSISDLCFLDEIDCQDLFEGKNKKERILIFEMI